MTKLSKAQEKRFDEKFYPSKEVDEVLAYSVDSEDVKQHLAEELTRLMEEIVEELEKIEVHKIFPVGGTGNDGTEYIELDQAIKTLKQKGASGSQNVEITIKSAEIK